MAWTQATPALYHFGSRNKEYFTVQLNARITHANPQLEWTVTGRRNDAVERKFQIDHDLTRDVTYALFPCDKQEVANRESCFAIFVSRALDYRWKLSQQLTENRVLSRSPVTTNLFVNSHWRRLPLVTRFYRCEFGVVFTFVLMDFSWEDRRKRTSSVLSVEIPWSKVGRDLDSATIPPLSTLMQMDSRWSVPLFVTLLLILASVF